MLCRVPGGDCVWSPGCSPCLRPLRVVQEVLQVLEDPQVPEYRLSRLVLEVLSLPVAVTGRKARLKSTSTDQSKHVHTRHSDPPTGPPFSPAGPGGPCGPPRPGRPVGPAGPAGPRSPGDPYRGQEKASLHSKHCSDRLLWFMRSSEMY